MSKNNILLSIAIIFFCASEWVGNYWLAHQINSHQSYTTIKPLESPASTRKETRKETIDKPIKNEATTLSVNTDKIGQRLEIIIQQEVQKALASYTQALSKATNNNTNNPTTSNQQESLNTSTKSASIPTTESEQAFEAALSIVSDAQLSSRWDETVNEQLSPYTEKMTRSQRNEIVGQYIQAFKEGLVEPGINPPF